MVIPGSSGVASSSGISTAFATGDYWTAANGGYIQSTPINIDSTANYTSDFISLTPLPADITSALAITINYLHIVVNVSNGSPANDAKALFASLVPVENAGLCLAFSATSNASKGNSSLTLAAQIAMGVSIFNSPSVYIPVTQTNACIVQDFSWTQFWNPTTSSLLGNLNYTPLAIGIIATSTGTPFDAILNLYAIGIKGSCTCP